MKIEDRVPANTNTQNTKPFLGKVKYVQFFHNILKPTDDKS